MYSVVPREIKDPRVYAAILDQKETRYEYYSGSLTRVGLLSPVYSGAPDEVSDVITLFYRARKVHLAQSDPTDQQGPRVSFFRFLRVRNMKKRIPKCCIKWICGSCLLLICILVGTGHKVQGRGGRGLAGKIR